MNQIKFSYDDLYTIIECKGFDKMKNICKIYTTGLGLNTNKIFFLCKSNNFNEKIPFKEYINKKDNKRDKIDISLNRIDISAINKKPLCSKQKKILCPICGDNCIVKENSNIVSSYECINKHNIDDSIFILNSKYKFHFCPLCKKLGKKNNQKFDSEIKYYISEFCKNPYISYCKNCNIHISMINIYSKFFNKIKIIYKIKISKNIDTNSKKKWMKIFQLLMKY